MSKSVKILIIGVGIGWLFGFFAYGLLSRKMIITAEWIQTIVLIITAIIIYYYTLETSRIRKETQKQNNQFKLQTETLQQQNFENIFLEMLKFHNEIVSPMTIEKGIRLLQGKDCFIRYYQKFKETNEKVALERVHTDVDRRLVTSYSRFYEANQSKLGHYFNNLFRIIEFVDLSKIPNKTTYTNLISTQLSSYEQMLLLYHCTSEVSIENFRNLVEKYKILNNLLDGQLVEREHVQQTTRFSSLMNNPS